jgi:hypothetical protein
MKTFKQFREFKIISKASDSGSKDVAKIEVAFTRGYGWHVGLFNEKDLEVHDSDIDGYASDESWHQRKKSAMDQAKDLQKKFPKAKIVTVR